MMYIKTCEIKLGATPSFVVECIDGRHLDSPIHVPGPPPTLMVEFILEDTDQPFLDLAQLTDGPVAIVPTETVQSNGELERALAALLLRRGGGDV
jgi:hypothetical protein